MTTYRVAVTSEDGTCTLGTVKVVAESAEAAALAAATDVCRDLNADMQRQGTDEWVFTPDQFATEVTMLD